MKPGDLVRFISDSYDRGVWVASIPQGPHWKFDEGTLAIILAEHHGPEMGEVLKFKVLVHGMTGWVYETDFEVVNETR